MDENELKSDECKIPTSFFDLNKKKRQSKLEKSSYDQNEKQLCLKKIIAENNNIINYLMQKFYHPLEVHNYYLSSFNDQIFVNNFSLFHEKNEPIYDFSITLFNTPIHSAEFIKNDKDLKSEPTNTSIVENGSSTNLNDILMSHYSNDISFSGSTCYNYISNNQLKKILSSSNYDDHINKENQLMVNNLTFLSLY